jgi:hypothetical protein
VNVGHDAYPASVNIAPRREPGKCEGHPDAIPESMKGTFTPTYGVKVPFMRTGGAGGSGEVEVGVGTAGQPEVAGAAIEERDPALGPPRLTGGPHHVSQRCRAGLLHV